MKKRFLFLLLVSAVFWVNPLKAQEAKPAEKPKFAYKPMKINFNEDGSQYLRIITWLQMWGSVANVNPGTIGLEGKAINTNADIGIRRARMLLMAQMSPKFLILTHFGINNQSFSTGGVNGTDGKKPQMYIHDAWTEYAVVPKYLSIGAGIHYWNGVSRLANASTLNFMTMDAPIFNWFTIETNDQFARQLGVYAKGQIKKLDYRFALNKPFVNGPNPYASTTGLTKIAKNGYAPTFAQAGYVKYMFKDAESNVLPFEVGTHLGGKKILNVGAGFYHHPKSTYTKDGMSADSVHLHATTVLGADVFYDAPVGTKGSSVSIYGLFQNMNYGEKYLRNIGILNTAPTVGTATQLGADAANASVYGGGNLQPTIGTGNIFYLQAGYKLPKMNNGAAIMPYATYTFKNFQAIGASSSQVSLGANYFVSDHNCKITAEYGIHPVYKADASKSTGVTQNGFKGQFTIQTHIFL